MLDWVNPHLYTPLAVYFTGVATVVPSSSFILSWITWPSGKVNLWPRARSGMVLPTITSIVMLSPGLPASSRVTLALRHSAGEGPSTCQCFTFPLVSFVSTYQNVCGLIHSTRVMVPLRTIGFLLSYSASTEWCARAGEAARNNPNAISTHGSLCLIASLPPLFARVRVKLVGAWHNRFAIVKACHEGTRPETRSLLPFLQALFRAAFAPMLALNLADSGGPSGEHLA